MEKEQKPQQQPSLSLEELVHTSVEALKDTVPGFDHIYGPLLDTGTAEFETLYKVIKILGCEPVKLIASMGVELQKVEELYKYNTNFTSFLLIERAMSKLKPSEIKICHEQGCKNAQETFYIASVIIHS